MNRPYYKGRPIASLESLAMALDMPLRQLDWVIKKADSLYRTLPPRLKKDGGYRELIDPSKPLKATQRRIVKHIFHRVHYPVYLQGGIKDKKSPRDYVQNTRIHSKSCIVINEDISNFYPSISDSLVLDVWQRFFQFPEEIARLLTQLTTLNGSLPQGAPTSSYLANLALWRVEPNLVMRLFDMGVRYSRLIDDITVSADCRLNKKDIGIIIGLIRKSATANQLRLKQRKHKIYTSGQQMKVNNVVVNRKPSLSKKERSQIRAAVHQIETTTRREQADSDYLQRLKSTTGRVYHLRRFHPKEGEQLLHRLVKIQSALRS